MVLSQPLPLLMLEVEEESRKPGSLPGLASPCRKGVSVHTALFWDISFHLYNLLHCIMHYPAPDCCTVLLQALLHLYSGKNPFISIIVLL